MAVNINQVKMLLQDSFPDASISLEDTNGDGSHLDLHIKCQSFTNVPAVQRHAMIYSVLGTLVGNEIHALSIQAISPEDEKTDHAHNHNNDNEKVFEDDILNKIHQAVNTHKVILFMKGTKTQPQCGFSATVVRILQELNVDDYMDVNVLASSEVREGIKQYSNWPTIPQLYINGKFIGGCDIVMSLHNEGVLKSLLTGFNENK